MAVKPVVKFHIKSHRGYTILEETEIDRIEQLEVRQDDVWVVSYPKSGTTLIQEIVYLLNTNLDFDQARSKVLDDRFPFLDILSPLVPFYRGVSFVEEMTSPRFIKSHLPLELLPQQLRIKKPKVIYIARNPKDVMVSFFHFLLYLRELDPGMIFKDFYEVCMADNAFGGPWWKHVLDFWNHRDEEHILYLKYEDVIQDLRGTVERIANFLGKKVTREEIDQVTEHCQFDNMKQNKSVNLTYMEDIRQTDPSHGNIIRKGKVGGWKHYFTEEMSQQVDKMMEDKLHGTGLTFDCS